MESHAVLIAEIADLKAERDGFRRSYEEASMADTERAMLLHKVSVERDTLRTRLSEAEAVEERLALRLEQTTGVPSDDGLTNGEEIERQLAAIDGWLDCYAKRYKDKEDYPFVMEAESRRADAAEARADRAEAEVGRLREHETVLASVMDAVNQELRESGPADVGQYYRINDARNGVRYLGDLLRKKLWAAQDGLAKSEALAEERGRVIENVRAIADRFNEDRHAHVGQVVAALWKALTPEPANEERCGCGHDLAHHMNIESDRTACGGDFPGGAKCGCFGWSPK